MNNNYFKLILFFLISFFLLSPTVFIIIKGGLSFDLENDLYLTRFITGSSRILLYVSIIVLLISVPLAWINTMTDFRGRKIVQVMCIFPLAVPAYISAYCYAEILEPGGYLSFIISGYKGFSLRNSVSASLVLGFSLFPYVYLLTRIAIINFSARYLEAAKTLGKSPYECFFKVSLPMALPGIAAGLALVLMETVNDFGVADFFGLQTLTIGVFQYISILNDLPAAFSLSLIILILMSSLYLFEQKLKGDKKFHNSNYEQIQWSKYSLSGFKTVIVLFLNSLPIIFGFLIPLLFSFYLFITHYTVINYSDYLQSLLNSILIGGSAGLVCIFISIFISYVIRFSNDKRYLYYKKIVNLGYALPGVVIALGVLILLISFNNVSPFSLSATLFGLILALSIRLIALSNNSIDSGLEKIGKSIDDAARMTGRKASTTYFRIIMPQLKISIIAGFLLVFVDTFKELPITLLLRPFNFDTLATNLYEYSSNEMFEYGSLNAITIIVSLSIVIYIFNSFIEDKMISKLRD